MPDTTARLLKLWERWPELRPEGLSHHPGSPKWRWSRHMVNEQRVEWFGESSAHAIAGWHLLVWLNSLDQWVDLSMEELTLGRVISAVYAAKGEKETP